jgi:hypothetical protein
MQRRRHDRADLAANETKNSQSLRTLAKRKSSNSYRREGCSQSGERCIAIETVAPLQVVAGTARSSRSLDFFPSDRGVDPIQTFGSSKKNPGLGVESRTA